MIIHLDSSFSIKENSFLNQLECALFELTVEQSVLSAVVNKLALSIELVYFHYICSQSGSFSCANFFNCSHHLW